MPPQDLSNFSMMDLFRTEVETQAAVLNEGLLSLESDARSKEKLASLMRAAHSIKGAARIVALDAVVKVSHAMEDCFVAAQEGRILLTGDGIDVLLQGVDWLTRVSKVSEAEAQNWFAEHQADIDRLAADITALKALQPEVESARPESTPAAVPVVEPKPVSPPALPDKAQAEKPAVSPAEPPRTTQLQPQPTVQSAEEKDRIVRVTAENLSRLMGLAGEALVEARWLEPFSSSLMQLKNRHGRLSSLLGKLREDSERLRQNENIEGTITEAQKMANECRQILADRINEFEVYARRSSNLSNRLYREVIASRMRPFSDGVQGFPRMVRDLAKQLGKKINFEIVGKSTGVDRDILEKLEAPLNHLLRNAIDHGIESPEERVVAGKPPEGNVRLEARHRAGMLSITISDDGRGVDAEQMRQKVVSKKLVAEEMAADLTEAELLEFLFLPGFSTAKIVTEISGRGVGLDILQNMLHEVGGSARAINRPGNGMTFQLQLPLTLSVLRTLLVEISGEPYAFPLSRIDRSLMIPKSQIELIEGRQFFRLDKESIGLVAAHQVFELEEKDDGGEELAIIVISDRLNRYGLVVDRFLAERELVIRPLDPRLGKLADISAAAVMTDGSPVLIVDVEDMVRSIDNLLSGGRLRKVSRAAARVQAKAPRRILVVDDSITVREVERKLLESAGYEVEVAVNGMDGWNAVRTSPYDLVITDVDMPRMNGIELVSHIKRDPGLKNLPVMIVSYKDREEDRLRGLEAGANFYLTKSSFHDETLLSAVVDLIGEASA
jgi:two-component system sensor histidine kinase and response regulator WspE